MQVCELITLASNSFLHSDQKFLALIKRNAGLALHKALSHNKCRFFVHRGWGCITHMCRRTGLGLAYCISRPVYSSGKLRSSF